MVMAIIHAAVELRLEDEKFEANLWAKPFLKERHTQRKREYQMKMYIAFKRYLCVSAKRSCQQVKEVVIASRNNQE